ncbi:MAG: phosphotransferase [Gemmatimonadota bacterium]
MLPASILRAARDGFGLPRGRVRLLSTRFGKVCLAHRRADGSRTQLRLVRAHPDTQARLVAEVRWLRHLAHTHHLAVPVPRPWHDGALVSPPLHDALGQRWYAAAFSWVPGHHLDRGLRARHFRGAGALLARLHRANVDVPDGIADARPTWWIPRLFDLATTLRNVVHDAAPLPPSVTPQLASGLRHAAAALQSAHDLLPDDAQHTGIIHTDAHWQNMRFTTRRIGIVDFEDFATGRFMLDVACLWGRVQARRDAPALLDALLSGYDDVTPLPPGHRRDLRVMLAFRRFDYAGWVLSWPRIDHEPWGPEFLTGTPAYIERLLAT